MSNQPTTIAAKFAAAGTNARVLAGVGALAVGLLATGTAATVATVTGASTDRVSSYGAAEQPAPAAPPVGPVGPGEPHDPAVPATSPPTNPPATTVHDIGSTVTESAPSVTAPSVTAAPGAPDPGVPADEVDEPPVEGSPGESNAGLGGSDWSPEGPGPGDDVPLDPAGEPVDPCATIHDPQQLFVLPVVTQIPSGAFSGHVTVLNCSPAPLPVEFAATHGMDFDQDDTVLPVGTSTHTFTIDENAVEVGAFELKYKLTQVGCCADYADVHGFKQGFNPDFHNPDLGLTAGAGQGGCKAGCITTAWVEGNQLNTSVELTVGTNVDAQIDAFVSTQAPVPNQVGDPSMPGLAPVLSTDGVSTSLTGHLGDLDAGTAYYVLVRAIDDNGTSTFVGQFTTVTPVEHPNQFGGNDPTPGCSAGCITHAVVNGVSAHAAGLTVATSMPATIEAWLSTSPIDESGQYPIAVDPAHHFTTPEAWTDWQLAMSGLGDETTYHVLVRATDGNGKRDHQIGSFTTPEAPPTPVRVSVDRIDVSDSGDLIGRGEVQFGFAYDGVLVGSISEQKLDDSATLYPSAHNFITTALASDEALKTFTTYAGERDVALGGFCEAPVPGMECHSGINWTAAFGGGLTLAEIAELPKCGPLGFEGDAADDHCDQVHGYEGIGDYVHFKVFIRYAVG